MNHLSKTISRETEHQDNMLPTLERDIDLQNSMFSNVAHYPQPEVLMNVTGGSNDVWWGDSSCSSCSDSDYDDWPETWHQDISTRSEIFYVECLPLEVSATVRSQSPASVLYDSNSKRSNLKIARGTYKWRKGAQGTLSKLVRKHKLHQQKSAQDSSKFDETKVKTKHVYESEGRFSNKVTFHDTQGGEIREVRMHVEPRKHNLGRRASLCETLLGLVPGHFSDQPPHNHRVMVAGFIPDTDAVQHKKIKIGDWLHSIDGQQLSHQNIDLVLSNITAPCTVTLMLQRVAGYDVTQYSPPYFMSKGIELEQMLHSVCCNSMDYSQGVMLLVCKSDQQSPECENYQEQLVYCYPDVETPPLQVSRGLFLTLLQLVPDYAQSTPQVTSVVLNDELLNVLYWQEDSTIVLFAVPESMSPAIAARDMFSYFMKALQFSYQSLTRCAQEKKNRLDLFVSCLLSELANVDAKSSIQDVLPSVHVLPLPQETQTDINNILAELESADFREELKTNYKSQRLFTILGSCLFYKGWNVCSHLPEGLLQYVHSLCWLHGLCNPQVTPVRKLLAWIQVHLPSEKEDEFFCAVPAKYYILLVGQNHKILAVLLESGGCTQRSPDVKGPNILYVEQAQAALVALEDVCISDVIENWYDFKNGASTQEGSSPVSGRANSRMTPATSTRSFGIDDAAVLGSKTSTTEGSSLLYKNPKMPSILKQQRSSGRGSENSEDACSQSPSENIRRPISDTSSEDSWAAGQESSLDSSVQECNVFNLGQSVSIKLIEDKPSCLFHFVHVECGTGVILIPLESRQDCPSGMISKMRNTCHQLSTMLHMDTSGVAVTELAVCWQDLQCSDLVETSPAFWVVGRHFKDPKAREVYVCYQDSITLNLVELAFRLALTL